MRKLSQGADYIGVGCVFFCHDGKGNILLHKRSKNCRDEIGRWDVGGGALELGESFEEAVKREVFEEYCTLPKKLRFLGVKNILRKDGDTLTHWVSLFFEVLVDPKTVKLGDPKKMDEMGWFRKNSLPKPLHSKFSIVLKMAQDATII